MQLLLFLFASFFVQPKTVYQFSFKNINGQVVQLSKFKGKKLLIVNTASKCGFTPQYKQLEELHKQYGNKIVVIGFPEGNFASQEYDSNREIKDFCEKNYGVTFLLAEKSSVKGADISPLFKYLTTQPNPDFTGDIKWNFEKFLINEKGQLIHRYRSATKPTDDAIISQL